ncbi:MAG: hypothetical protein CSA73_00485 [Rhodobacterales bacterium]|nr:MAG: hypothetical protein CSA73_00485 [Rhodobacterales bacterium]
MLALKPAKTNHSSLSDTARKLRSNPAPATILTYDDPPQWRGFAFALLDIWPLFDAFQLTHVSKGPFLE